VGLVCEVLQQTPRDVTVALPSDVTLPPLLAVVGVILAIASVVTVGGEAGGSFFLHPIKITEKTSVTTNNFFMSSEL